MIAGTSLPFALSEIHFSRYECAVFQKVAGVSSAAVIAKCNKIIWIKVLGGSADDWA